MSILGIRAALSGAWGNAVRSRVLILQYAQLPPAPLGGPLMATSSALWAARSVKPRMGGGRGSLALYPIAARASAHFTFKLCPAAPNLEKVQIPPSDVSPPPAPASRKTYPG